MTDIVVRRGRREDCKEIRRLIQELADFEKMPDGPVLDDKDLERDGFELNPPRFYCFVAEDPTNPSKLVGYALYYYTYGSWTGHKMYLEDIFVSKDFRGKKIGDALFLKVVEKGVEDNCVNMDFVVLDWNPAKDFYSARGAKDMTSAELWRLFRLHTEDMKALVKKSSTPVEES